MKTEQDSIWGLAAAPTALATIGACILFLLALAPSASAAPPLLWQACDADEPAGQQCGGPTGVAANRLTGHVFVADQANHRIVEFDASGQFVKAWGWDVVASGPGDDTIAPEDQFESCVPEDGDVCKAGIAGHGAGQFRSPRGVAVDSAGAVYVVDWLNRRVQKFNRAGEFLLAWGGDVVFTGPGDTGIDEQQQITIAATAGSFRLGLSDMIDGGAPQETAPLPFNASAAQVQAALNALPTIAGLGGSVTVGGGPGDATGSSPYTITFGGNLANDDVPELTVALEVGSQLKCSTSTLAESISYQWFRDGEEIEGATASTYTATEADKGWTIQCRVTATNANAGSVDVSNPAQVIAPAPRGAVPVPPATIPPPTTSAPLTVGGAGGQTLSCDPDLGNWKNADFVWGYRWYRNGVEIDSSGFGASVFPTYEVTASDLASPAVFQCEATVRGEPPGGLEVAKASEPLMTTPAPSAPAAPQAKASTAPANAVSTPVPGGGHEICRPADTCKGGSEGTADGEFGEWAVGSFIAIDTKGTATDVDDDVHVGDEGRIQRFDTEGVYEAQIALPGKTVQSLAVDGAGNLYYSTGNNTVSKLSPTGAPIPPSFAIPKADEFTSRFINAIAIDSVGQLYVFADPSQRNGFVDIDRIYRFDPTGSIVESFGAGEFGNSTGLATNLCPGSTAPGNLYVSNQGIFGAPSSLRAYGTPPSGCGLAITLPATGIEETSVTLHGTVNPNALPVTDCRFEYGLTVAPYEASVPCAESSAQIGEGFEPVPVHADVSGLAAGTVYHFRLVAESPAGIEKGSDRTFKTLGPPVISEEHVLGATDTEASVKALVNPEGFPTTYRVEYGLDTTYGQSTPEIAVGKDRSDHVVVANLSGLAPGTTYHWRVVATNSSDTTEGQDLTLTTYRPFAPETSCPNQVLRTGSSALLPDCRAYEMVSPVDKNGGDIVIELSTTADPGGYMQAAPDGDRIAYSSSASFAGQPSSFRHNQYLAERSERGNPGEGWRTEGIHPTVKGESLSFNPGFSRAFMAFSEDLCSAWLVDYQAPPPSPDGQEGFKNLYRRQNCGAAAGSLEAMVPTPPALPEGTPKEYVGNKSVQGVSADGRHAFIVAGAELTPEAKGAGVTAKVYDRFDGENHLVSVLPDGTPSSGASGVGSGWHGNLQGAVSSDGSRVYWTAATGKIYLREHPEQGVVAGECSEPGIACTIEVSEGGSAFFWAGAADGSVALYSEGNLESGQATLYEFDLEAADEGEPPRLVAEDVENVIGVSDDLSRVYFVSDASLPETAGIAGEPNVYLYEVGVGGGEASYELVATVSEADVVDNAASVAVDEAYNLGSPSPILRATRVSPDGSRIAFNSRAPLTDYDNTDTASGVAAVEVYLYDAEAGELHCVSCNPSGARPQGQAMRTAYARPHEMSTLQDVPAGAWIPTWEHPNHASNVLSADGNRLFFNAADALVPRDVNAAQDVYQWEAVGTGGCTPASLSYFPQNGGCLDLISSGESSYESEFWEASPDGEDVFFTTASSFVPQDPGSVDLYDARVNGGFPAPVEAPACEGEACQSPPPSPNDPTPASASFRGPGDPSQAGPPKRRCPKGQRKARRKGNARCVKRKRPGAQRKRRANHDRRAQR
ncbi:MAG TPA: hypothetical protein VF729_06025 [Solirubrobacterales bacterium]